MLLVGVFAGGAIRTQIGLARRPAKHILCAAVAAAALDSLRDGIIRGVSNLAIAPDFAAANHRAVADRTGALLARSAAHNRGGGNDGGFNDVLIHTRIIVCYWVLVNRVFWFIRKPPGQAGRAQHKPCQPLNFQKSPKSVKLS